MSFLSLSKKVKNREITPTELVEKSLDKIKTHNPTYNAMLTLCEEEALEEAAKAEKEINNGELKGPLHGIPVALKDVVFTENIRTTMGSKIYENYIPDYDATVVRKLKEAGAIIIGKAHTHEFAFGPTGDRSYFGPCKNPHDPAKIPGGSSSGSAAAVALDMVSIAIGTDTGGSVRVPASACGVVGMKPTFGLVSKYGIHNTAYSLDHPGPITKTVKDNAILLNVLAGYDPKDEDSINIPQEDYSRFIGKSIKGRTIGLPTFFFNNLEEEVEVALKEVVELYSELGAHVVSVEVEGIEEIAEFQRTVIQAEAYAVHNENMENRSSDYEQELLERLRASKTVPAYQYVLAQKKKHELIRSFNNIFDVVDVLLTPTIPILPTDLDQREVQMNDHREPVRNALLRLTSPINYTGNPALSVPSRKSTSGLPIGFQLIGKHLDEAVLYQFGHVYEQGSQ